MWKRILTFIFILVTLCNWGAKATPVYASTTAVYIVQPGDTLTAIATRHGISTSQLAAANNLYWYSWVYIGQRLIIPTGTVAPAPSTGNVYIVQRGDTLTSIALRMGISLTDLAAANGLYPQSWVYVGQRLILPGTGTVAPAPSTGSTYIVQRGDTLFSIARRYGTTVNALKATNGLTSNFIYAGQRLAIPGGNGTPAIPNPPTPPPSHGTNGEKWIDVNLSTQSLVAYEGQTAVFNSLLSSGTAAYPTVVGTYSIYAKYVATNMSGGSGASYYNLPNVPYTMYFYRGYALHGTYWHNNFGTPMSHGCVNLPTPNAEWLFNWAPIGTKVVTHY
ncbi:MAG: LysM peptidoglycan-binding domain-containing protein [Anaerolineae bacterium]|nr:LysM peptidoglycan-binding domain-containing protein [Anaerolineae bacterium]